ncbi:unnamed protein product [Phytophthora fragariaefolia]|uniref:Unnamed protein product n=1 Tax=Phytophthora fragariaefolia TaxID=1490495 RepID=A0A9W6TID1_9STRA|nr:unnamed protein product [Phytophthora fragariaefolia]
MLDQQVLERQQRENLLAQDEAADEAKRIAEARQAEADQEAYGRAALFHKYATKKHTSREHNLRYLICCRYSKLMGAAEERHDYMKWRRDRALRLPAARTQLRRLQADDMTEWAAGTDVMIVWGCKEALQADCFM